MREITPFLSFSLVCLSSALAGSRLVTGGSAWRGPELSRAVPLPSWTPLSPFWLTVPLSLLDRPVSLPGGSAGWSLSPAVSDSRCALPAVEEDGAAGTLRGQRTRPPRPPLPCALASSPGRRPLSLPQTLITSLSPQSPQRFRPRAFGFGAPGLVQTVVTGKSRSPSDTGVCVCQGGRGWECGLCCRKWGLRGDLRRPETAGGPRRSGRGGVASPVLRVNEKHPITLSARGARPGDLTTEAPSRACSACTAGRRLRGDAGGHRASVVFPLQST